jgi:adenylate kinase family enzyme
MDDALHGDTSDRDRSDGDRLGLGGFGTIGKRIQVVGTTCAGKSTLAERLAAHLGVPYVELDALNWQPGWVGLADVDPDELMRQLTEATAGDGWVVAGSYRRFTQPVLGPRLQTIVWIDLPLPLILRRVVTRSWRRWRSGELLWGTNREDFWTHLKLWSDESLIHWALTTHHRTRRRLQAEMADPAWAHVRFVRLRSVQQVDAFAAAVVAAA